MQTVSRFVATDIDERYREVTIGNTEFPTAELIFTGGLNRIEVGEEESARSRGDLSFSFSFFFPFVSRTNRDYFRYPRKRKLFSRHRISNFQEISSLPPSSSSAKNSIDNTAIGSKTINRRLDIPGIEYRRVTIATNAKFSIAGIVVALLSARKISFSKRDVDALSLSLFLSRHFDARKRFDAFRSGNSNR